MQIICTTLHTDNHASTSSLIFTCRMLFLTPNQQRQSTEGRETEKLFAKYRVCEKRLTPIVLATLAGDPLSTPICPLDSAHWTPPIVSHVAPPRLFSEL